MAGKLRETTSEAAVQGPSMWFTRVVATDGKKTFVTETNEWGWFQIDGLPETAITLRIEKPGWQIRRPLGRIDLRGNSCVNLDVQASPD